MLLEDIIAKILSVRPELTREEILNRIREKERSAKGFLTPESAALSLAADLGISFKVDLRRDLKIKDLVSGLNDVTVSGRVIYVDSLRSFLSHEGREGFKRVISLADDTGLIKATLWNEKAFLIDADVIDEIVRLSHVSVRRESHGKMALNAGPKSIIEINPKDLDEKSYPPLTSFTKKIGELSSQNKQVNIVGIVKRVHPPSIFKRQDGEGKVRLVEISDESGRVLVVLWDENADAISEEHVERYVMLLEVRVKERFDGGIEIHSGKQTKVLLLRRKPSGFK
ncbi:MAG: OB-fold nucleic acid binding domain-containing protein [Candidatus Bathyarchaeota archaeon]|nr:OB-fold nucleic acid binding domain-containing protein [Candidatus Bathyarchaeota archaeon]